MFPLFLIRLNFLLSPNLLFLCLVNLFVFYFSKVDKIEVYVLPFRDIRGPLEKLGSRDRLENR